MLYIPANRISCSFFYFYLFIFFLGGGEGDEPVQSVYLKDTIQCLT